MSDSRTHLAEPLWPHDAQGFIVDVQDVPPCAGLLEALAKAVPLHVGFKGATSEPWHDAFEPFLASTQNDECLTTWSDERSIDELIIEARYIHLPLMGGATHPLVVLAVSHGGEGIRDEEQTKAAGMCSVAVRVLADEEED